MPTSAPCEREDEHSCKSQHLASMSHAARCHAPCPSITIQHGRMPSTASLEYRRTKRSIFHCKSAELLACHRPSIAYAHDFDRRIGPDDKHVESGRDSLPPTPHDATCSKRCNSIFYLIIYLCLLPTKANRVLTSQRARFPVLFRQALPQPQIGSANNPSSLVVITMRRIRPEAPASVDSDSEAATHSH